MATEETTLEATLAATGGAFMSNLTRNNKKIREDRAQSISEDTEVLYRRKIEDLQQELRKKQRDRENMLDLSPTSADSLIMASDFKANEFVDKDLQISVELRNLQIQLEIARDRYQHLFGKSA